MLYDKIKNIAEQKNISIYRIEKDLDLSNGSIIQRKTLWRTDWTKSKSIEWS